ncbi:MAG: histidine kinase [Flavobacteriaceae bacterium]|nr:histidine kinase [Flavobacteriaceae bacterium]
MFYSFLSLESKLLEERCDRNLEVTNLEGRANRAQMNPHFIFNALNGMQSAMVLGGEKEFNSYISSFSKLIRDTIDMSSVDKITVADEIKYITNYVKLQDHRLDEKVDLEIHVDPKINQNDVYLPCMMLQPIIENAIVHGIIPKQDSGIIKIGLTIQESMLRICVTDNGIGREAAAAQKEKYTKHKSYATQIMRDRIDIFNYYNQQKLAFSIEDLFDEAGAASGTKATLLVPLELKTRN